MPVIEPSHSSVFRILCIIGTVLSSLASGSNLILIWDMQVWNGHLALITAMTVFQLLYDVSFYDNNINEDNRDTFIFSTVFQIWGGISQALISNEIAFAVLYIIWYKRPFKIFQNFPWLMLAANLPSFVLCFVFLLKACAFPSVGLLEDFGFYGYFYTRLLSIVTIYLTYGYSMHIVRQMRSTEPSLAQQERAIKSIVRRMSYFPLMQAVSRSGYIVYELLYGFEFNPPDTSTSTPQFVSQCFVAILTPLGAIGYFLVFLKTQPNAWRHLVYRLTSCQRLASVDKSIGLPPHRQYGYLAAAAAQGGTGGTVPLDHDPYYLQAADEELFHIMTETLNIEESVSVRASLLHGHHNSGERT